MNKFCGMCGSRINPKTGLCPQCNSDLNNRSNKGILLAATVFTIVILFVACVFVYPKGYFASAHLFQAHMWDEANCVKPVTCKSCGLTKGEARGHIAGNITVTEDTLNAEILTVQQCADCGKVLEESNEPILSFLGTDEFKMTPDQFMERYYSILEEAALDSRKLSYEAKAAIYDSNTTDEKLMYQITYDGEVIAHLYCYNQANEMIRFDEKNKSHFWCMVLRIPIETGDSAYIAVKAYDSLMAACDPNFATDEREQYVECWSFWLGETLTKDGNRLYQAKNNILYCGEVVPHNDSSFFYFSAYATMNLGNLYEGAIDTEQKAAAQNPHYDTNTAEAYIAGTWRAKYMLYEDDDGVYEYSLDKDDDITISFGRDHSAAISVKKFRMDEEDELGLTEWLNGCPMQWYYMYDTGDTLYFLLDTPGMAASIPCQYATDTKYDGTVRIPIVESVYMVFERR